MIADDIRDFAFSLGRAQAQTAQAAHDARQPEIDRLRRALEQAEQQLDYGQHEAAHKIILAALAKHAKE